MGGAGTESGASDSPGFGEVPDRHLDWEDHAAHPTRDPAMTQAQAAPPAIATDVPADIPSDLEATLERYRSELTGYCYRMLGSTFEAEDAVQDTFLRAWRSFDRFEGRSAVRSWLYRIATNVCLDALNGRKRRERPIDMGPASSADRALPDPLSEEIWVEPIPDAAVVPAGGDPADVAVARESIRLAFVAALQHLPPKQRAVLILREVLRWKADEVAELLDSTVASVNSALQRARATMAELDGREERPLDPDARELLERYVDAFERYDIDAFVQLLHDDATQHMPPYEIWMRGSADIAAWMLGPGAGCRNSRVFPIEANGQPAVVQYRPVNEGGDRKSVV